MTVRTGAVDALRRPGRTVWPRNGTSGEGLIIAGAARSASRLAGTVTPRVYCVAIRAVSTIPAPRNSATAAGTVIKGVTIRLRSGSEWHRAVCRRSASQHHSGAEACWLARAESPSHAQGESRAPGRTRHLMATASPEPVLGGVARWPGGHARNMCSRPLFAEQPMWHLAREDGKLVVLKAAGSLAQGIGWCGAEWVPEGQASRDL